MRAVLHLVHLFNSILPIYHFPPVWKHVRLISILKPGKDPTQLSSYRLVNLLGTICKLFEVVFTRILHQVGECGLLREEQFGFRPGLSITLRLARLVERITMKFGEKSLTGEMFLDLAKAFDTVCIEGIL